MRQISASVVVKAARDRSGNLVITNVDGFLAVLLVLCILGAIAVWFTPVGNRTAAGWTALFAVFSLALIAAQERSSFVIDRTNGVLSWHRQKAFAHRRGQITLTAITKLSLERDQSSGERWTSRRLVIHTLAGPLPVNTGYSGMTRNMERVGEMLREYLAEILPQRHLQLSKD